MLNLHAIHGKIVNEDLHEGRDVIVENFSNNSLEGGWCHLQSEHHDDCHKETPFGDKCCIFLVVPVHADLIIAVEV